MKKDWKYFIKLIGVCFVLLFSLSYSEGEIPNTVVKDNPKAEVTTVKSKERRTTPAELNIEVKKVKSSDLAGSVDTEKKEIKFDLSEAGMNAEASRIITKDKLIHVTKELETYPSVSTTNGRKKWSNVLEKYKTAKRTGKAVENDGLITELIEIAEEGKQLKKELKVGYTEENPPSNVYIGVLNKNNYELEKIYKYGKNTFSLRGTVNDMLILKSNFPEARVIRLNSNYSFIGCGEYAHFNRRGIDNVLDVNGVGWFSTGRLDKNRFKYGGIIPFAQKVTAKFTTVGGDSTESGSFYLAPKEIYAGSTETSTEYGGPKWSTDEILGLPYDETKRFPNLDRLPLSSWPKTNYAGTSSKSGWGMIFEYGLIVDNTTLSRLVGTEKRIIEIVSGASVPLYVFINASWGFSSTRMEFFKAGEIKTNLVLERNIIMSSTGDDYLKTGIILSNELKYPSNLDLNNLTDMKASKGTIENIVKTAEKYTAEYISASGTNRFKIEIVRNNNIKFEILKWNGEEIKTSLNLEYAENGLKFYKDTINIEISPTTEYVKNMHLKIDGYDFTTKYENKNAVYTIYGLDEVKLGNTLKEGGTTKTLEVLNKNIVYENDFNLKGITIKSEKGTTKNVMKDKDRNAVIYTSPSGNSEFIIEFVKDFNLKKTKLKLTVNKWNEEGIDEVFNITGAATEKILLNISERKTEKGSAKITFSNSYAVGNIAVYENGTMNDPAVAITEMNNFLSVPEVMLKSKKIEIYAEEILVGASDFSTMNTLEYRGTELKVGMDSNYRLKIGLSYWSDIKKVPLKIILKNENNEVLGEYAIEVVLPTTGITISREIALNSSFSTYFDVNIYTIEFVGPDKVMHTDHKGVTYSNSGTMTGKYDYPENITIDSIEQLSTYNGVKISIINSYGSKKYALDLTEAVYGSRYPEGGLIYTVEASKKYAAGKVILIKTRDITKSSNVQKRQDYKFLVKATDSATGTKYRDILHFREGYGSALGSQTGNGTIILSREYRREEIELGENIQKAEIVDAVNFPPSGWVYYSSVSSENHLIQNGNIIAQGIWSIRGEVKDEEGKSNIITLRYDSENKLYLKLKEIPTSPINVTYKLYNKLSNSASDTLILKGEYDIRIQPPESEKGTVDVQFAGKYKAADGLQKIGGAEDSNDLVTISNISGIYPMSPDTYRGTEKIEVLSNSVSLGEMYIGNIKSYELKNGTKIKLQVENENINLGLESWKSNTTEEMTVLLKNSTGFVLGKYTFNVTTPSNTRIVRSSVIRLENINDLKIDTRYYLQENGIKANSTTGWGWQGNMSVNVTNYDMTGEYISYPLGTNFPTFKFVSENCTTDSTASSESGAYIKLSSDKFDGVFAIDITADLTGTIYPQLHFSGKVKKSFRDTIIMTYNDGINYYEDNLTIIIPERSSKKEEGNAKLIFNNAYSPSDGFLEITQKGVDPAYAELNVSSGTFPPTIGELSNNFEILSGGNKVVESSNMEIVETVLKNMTLRTGYMEGKLNLMIYDWIPGKEDTIELVLKNGTTEKGRYTLGIKAPRQGLEIISGSDILNFGTIVRGNKEVSRSSTWMTVDMAEEVEISAIKAELSAPYIYLNGISSTEEEKRIKILKIEAKGSKNKYEKNYYDLTVEGELEAVKKEQVTGSYEGSVTLEMYIK